MITLIDRADGAHVCQLTPEEFRLLQQQLVRESEEDFDYYLNDATLDLLRDVGLGEAALEALSERMKHRGLDVGWVLGPVPELTVYRGSLVDSEVRALGGIRVDLMSSEGLISWSYSDSAGEFRVVGEGAKYLRLSGRGDLVLRHFPLAFPGDQGQFELQTLSGSVLTDTDEPLAGVTVQLLRWKSSERHESATWQDLGGQRSWGDTDEEGRFAIPVSLPEDLGPLHIELELTAVSGQTLESVALTVDSEAGFDLGTLRAPKPDLVEIEDEQEASLAE